MGYCRFWENKKANEEGLKECAVKQRAEQHAGMEEVLLLEDATEINLERHRERIKGKQGLGATGNGADMVFSCRPTLVAAPKDRAVIGVLDIYAREKGTGEKKARRERNEGLPIERKETYRWISRAAQAKGRLWSGRRAVVARDREEGIYESLYVLREERLEYVMRASHDRMLFGREEHLNEYINELKSWFEYSLEVKGDKKGGRSVQPGWRMRCGK